MESYKTSLGFNIQYKSWLIDVDSYWHFSDAIPILNSYQSEQLEIDETGSSEAIGLEVLVKKRWNRWSSGFSYHLSAVDYKFPNYIDDRFSGNNDQRHNLAWINHYRSGKWSFGSQYNYRSGLPYTEVSGLQLVEEDDEDFYEIEVDGLNDLRLKSYHRFDVNMGYATRMFQTFNLDIQLSLLNIFDFGQVTQRSYIVSNTDVVDDDPELVNISKRQLGLTPQLVLRCTF